MNSVDRSFKLFVSIPDALQGQRAFLPCRRHPLSHVRRHVGLQLASAVRRKITARGRTALGLTGLHAG